MTTEHLQYGPRLAAHPTGALHAAILATPSDAIERARPLEGEPSPIGARARGEHEVLAKTLRYFGVDVTVLPAPSDDPYACAIADLAVVFENGAVVMRPSSMTRRPESAWIEQAFARLDVPIAGHLVAPGLLDGGDVLLAGTTAFVAASARSNALGRAGFAQIAQAHGFHVVEVPLAAGLAPLRSVASAVASDTIVYATGCVDGSVFASAGFKTIAIEPSESLGAGVLCIGEHHVIADLRFPRAVGTLRKSGVTVEALDLYDFARAGITPSLLAIDRKRG